jgi:sugar (pentulose or hexulose) kinase
MVDNCYHYRDVRTKGVLDKLFNYISKKEIFQRSGIQFMEINTSTQLFSLVHNDPAHLKESDTLLMVPDYLNYLLCGKKYTEYSIATTTQLFNPKTSNWSKELIERIGLDYKLFQKIIPSGTILGNLNKEIVKDLGLSNALVIAPACHDTGSAIAAVPVDMKSYKRGEWAYLSSGTWSLLGVELDKAIINEKTLEFNFTNEGGVENTIRFLKNVTGLWLIQKCKKEWEKQGLDYTWDEIEVKASKAKPYQSFINPDDSNFYNPPSMVDAIKNYCKKTSQSVPEKIGEIARTIFESLAFRYKQILNYIEEIIGKEVKILFIIGGGSSNDLLNQFTANSLNIHVKAGPIEATAIGNILVQAKAVGLIKNLNELRDIVIKSFHIREYFPKNVNNWISGYRKYLKYTY